MKLLTILTLSACFTSCKANKQRLINELTARKNSWKDSSQYYDRLIFNIEQENSIHSKQDSIKLYLQNRNNALQQQQAIDDSLKEIILGK